jgi:ABC-2 type transport system ATP-binding protein
MEGEKAVIVRNLAKSYGSVHAVNGISFEVPAGEIFGIVGPNGAGKTTTVECLESLRTPDSGTIRILGLDPRKQAYQLRPLIGVQLQNSALPPRIKVYEALELFASFYRNSVSIADIVARLDLKEIQTRRFQQLSGGQKQRLFIALALINNPRVVFLDELTTGLDPQARRNMWDLIRRIREGGSTIVLTTHYMEEAERLCDRVAILDGGKILVLDTPDQLVARLGAGVRVRFRVLDQVDPEIFRRMETVQEVDVRTDQFIIRGTGDQFIAQVVTALCGRKIRFRDFRTEHPNLEDVYLSLTGHHMRI